MSVVGYDADPSAAERALDIGAIDDVGPSPQDAVEDADVTVLAMPVDRVVSACRVLEGAVPESAVITDVASAKSEVVAAGERSFGGSFVGGHPMAGSETQGIDAAHARLFENARWILTPTAKTSVSAYSTVAELVTLLRARPVALDPRVHDSLVARLSHVPQLAASALVDVAAEPGDRATLLDLAAGGFRDVTRIAASSPDLWVTILRSNQAAVLEALDELRGRLAEIAAMISEARWGDLRLFLHRARQARVELGATRHYGGAPVRLSVLAPDRPGVVAEVTTAAGRLGANIQNVTMVDSTEGCRGRLDMVVAGEERAGLVVAALRDLGYRVDRSEPISK
jgi:prephenate dehydrogenase